jgi:hypothetical protein
MGGALGKQFGPPGSELTWNLKNASLPAFGSKCGLFNYGNAPVFDVRLTFDISIKNVVVNDGGGKSSGDILQSGQWVAVIPKLDQGTNSPFEFYFFNRFSPYFIMIDQTPTATFIRSSNSVPQTLKVISAAHNQPIFLNPADVGP